MLRNSRSQVSRSQTPSQIFPQGLLTNGCGFIEQLISRYKDVVQFKNCLQQEVNNNTPSKQTTFISNALHAFYIQTRPCHIRMCIIMWDPFKVRYRVLLKRRSQLLNDLQQIVWAGVDQFGSGCGEGQAAGSSKDGKDIQGSIKVRGLVWFWLWRGTSSGLS